MQMELNFKIRKNRILYITGQGLFFIITITLLKNISCPFKKIFRIPCPFCGMTRSLNSLLNLKIIESLHYNILLLPIIIIILIINSIFIIEIIKNKRIIKYSLNKYTILIIVIIFIISIIWGINNKI